MSLDITNFPQDPDLNVKFQSISQKIQGEPMENNANFDPEQAEYQRYLESIREKTKRLGDTIEVRNDLLTPGVASQMHSEWKDNYRRESVDESGNVPVRMRPVGSPEEFASLPTEIGLLKKKYKPVEVSQNPKITRGFKASEIGKTGELAWEEIEGVLSLNIGALEYGNLIGRPKGTNDIPAAAYVSLVVDSLDKTKDGYIDPVSDTENYLEHIAEKIHIQWVLDNPWVLNDLAPFLLAEDGAKLKAAVASKNADAIMALIEDVEAADPGGKMIHERIDEDIKALLDAIAPDVKVKQEKKIVSLQALQKRIEDGVLKQYVHYEKLTESQKNRDRIYADIVIREIYDNMGHRARAEGTDGISLKMGYPEIADTSAVRD